MDIPIPDRDAAAQLEALNACPEDAFVAALGESVYPSPAAPGRESMAAGLAPTAQALSF